MKILMNLSMILMTLISLVGSAYAQAWKPTERVTLVIPYGAGGGADALGRAIARELETIWGQTVVVENLGGAEGLIGTNKVIAAPANGQTLLLNISSMLLTKHLPGMKGADPIVHLDPVGVFATSPALIIASPATPGNTLREVVAGCQRPNASCAVGLAGNNSKLIAKHFAQVANLPNLTTANYRSSGQIVTDLIGGSLPLAFNAPTGIVPHHNAGRIKVLAVLAPKRIRLLPDVPTSAEAGFTGIESEIWWALFVKKGTPPAVIEGLALASKRATEQPAVRDAVASGGSEALWAGPAEAARIVREGIARYEELVRKYPLE